MTISGEKVAVDASVSSQEIALLTPDVMDTFEPEGVLVAVTTTATAMGDSNTGSIAPLSISTADLLVTTIVERVSTPGDTTYDKFKFTATATWSNIWHTSLTDKLAMAWSDGFTLYADNCWVYLFSDKTTATSAPCTRSTISPEAGISYDLAMNTGTGIYKVKMIAYGMKNQSTGTANLVAQYAHETIGFGSINVLLSGSPGITYSGSLIYNLSEAAYSSWSY